jgi:hypothetical protein
MQNPDDDIRTIEALIARQFTSLSWVPARSAIGTRSLPTFTPMHRFTRPSARRSAARLWVRRADAGLGKNEVAFVS